MQMRTGKKHLFFYINTRRISLRNNTQNFIQQRYSNSSIPTEHTLPAN